MVCTLFTWLDLCLLGQSFVERAGLESTLGWRVLYLGLKDRLGEKYKVDDCVAGSDIKLRMN